MLLNFLGNLRNNPDVPQQRIGYRKCCTFAQWSTTLLLKTEFMKFTGNWMELENIILIEITELQKNTWYEFTDKWILGKKKPQNTHNTTHRPYEA